MERAGTRLFGRVLDAGCGGGGTAVSLAEEAGFAVGLDLDARFLGSGTRLVAEKGVRNTAFVQGDGERLPFRGSAFDLVLSHSVIEHVRSAPAYLRECHRVLRPGGVLYLSTAPYLSLAGAHLPRLLVPVPLHILFGRRAAFRAFRLLARRAPWLLQEPKEANIHRDGGARKDKTTTPAAGGRCGGFGLDPGRGVPLVREDRQRDGFFRRARPPPARRLLEREPLLRDVMIGHIQLRLVKQ